MAPLAVLVPLRLWFFGDASPITEILLGPAVEECIKLAGILIGLTFASVVLRGGRDPALALRYWLFLSPWIVGGLYGMAEGLLAYQGQSSLNFTLREAAHASFAALGLATALSFWRTSSSRYFGLVFGLEMATCVHLGYNLIAFLSDYLDVTFLDQALYLLAASVVAFVALAGVVRREPASPETRLFLPAARGKLRP